MKGYIRDLIVIMEGSKARIQHQGKRPVCEAEEAASPNRYPISSV
jgi:plastocyanin domain-containing protein